LMAAKRDRPPEHHIERPAALPWLEDPLASLAIGLCMQGVTIQDLERTEFPTMESSNEWRRPDKFRLSPCVRVFVLEAKENPA
jgi:hypothetical protein